MAGALRLGWDILSGKNLKKMKKLRKNIRKNHPTNREANKFAKKSVRKAKHLQNLARGTVLVGGVGGVGGAYLATKHKKDNDSIIPPDY